MLPRLRLGLEIFIPICCRRSPQDAYSESESDWGDEDEGGGRAAANARGRPPLARRARWRPPRTRKESRPRYKRASEPEHSHRGPRRINEDHHTSSVVEPEPAGAGIFSWSWSRSR